MVHSNQTIPTAITVSTNMEAVQWRKLDNSVLQTRLSKAVESFSFNTRASGSVEDATC